MNLHLLGCTHVLPVACGSSAVGAIYWIAYVLYVCVRTKRRKHAARGVVT